MARRAANGHGAALIEPRLFLSLKDDATLEKPSRGLAVHGHPRRAKSRSLISPRATGDDVAVFAGREDEPGFAGRCDEAVAVVSAFIRAFTRQTITLVTNDADKSKAPRDGVWSSESGR